MTPNCNTHNGIFTLSYVSVLNINSTLYANIFNQGHCERVLIIFSPNRKETSNSDQTRDLFNILPTKLNKLLSPLLYLFQATQKEVQNIVLPTRSARQQWPSASEEKWRNFNCFFSVQGTGGSPTVPDPENRVGHQYTGSPGRPVSSGLQMPCEPGHFRARKRQLFWPSRCVLSSKCPSKAPAEISDTRRW